MAILHPLPRSTPEKQGVSSAAVLAFIEAVEQEAIELHSLMLLRHGQVVAEGWWAPYGEDDPHMLFSLSKSFTSTAVGLAVAEGRLTVDDPVLSFFPEDAPPEVNEHLQALRVRHLLSMSTGQEGALSLSLLEQLPGNWVQAFLAWLPKYAPGTQFLYNSGASYLLSAIVQRVTGETLLQYLQTRLFAPLGIENATWESCPRGINTGGWGLSIKTEDIARFGQLYLQNGTWQGRQLVPAAWIAEATSIQIRNGSQPESDWEQGYGYQFWRCRHGAYRGDGAFGQFCIVMPEQDAVLAMTAGTPDMQRVLNLVWEHVLPGLRPAGAPLPADPALQQELVHRLANLSIRPPQGQPSSPLAAQVSGRRYVFPPNEHRLEAVRIDFAQDHVTFVAQDDRGEHRVACGSDNWLKGVTAFDNAGPQPVAARGAWTDENTYTIKICYYETPFCPTITCRFAGDTLQYDNKANVSFDPTGRPQVVGQSV